MGTPVAAKLSAATGVSGIPTWIMICAMVVLVASLGATAWRRGLLQFGVNAPGLAATLKLDLREKPSEELLRQNDLTHRVEGTRV